MKLCLRPSLNQIRSDNGIGRVVAAQYKYLPAHGFEFVDDAADLYIGHTQQFDMPRIDVLILHGFYWLGDKGSGDYGGFHMSANNAIIEAARKAKTLTVPSQWVGECLRRDMRIDPTVIGHGIDFDEWQPADNKGYALWAKNRVFDVCRPDAPYELAMRGLNIVSTFAPEGMTVPKNMLVIDRQESDGMKEWLQHAGVYLATTKETFGIQTLEAMACGVPIVGWNTGGTAEIVTQGYNGLLVKTGDYDALAQAVTDALARRAELGRNARETARRYDWSHVIGQYADLFRMTHEAIRSESHGVGVIITAHNYGRYVTEAVDSAMNQSHPPAEIVVVDDGSIDDTLERLAPYNGTGVKVIAQTNQGVAAARTTGIRATRSPYLICLDADDRLDPRYIETLLPAIDATRDVGIVYSGLTLFNDDGEHQTQTAPVFDWERQTTPTDLPSTCIPSAAMFRREMWRRAGPHKQEYAPGEDTEFWTRALSVGFKAQKVTDEGLFWWRLHDDSASHRWRYKPIDDRLPWMRDKQYPLAAPSNYSPLIRSYSEPKVSIIVAVTGEQAALLPDTLDSILGQTMREWEVIVVNTTGTLAAYEYHDRYPFMRYISLKQIGNVTKARNDSLSIARADLVLFLDCGDMLTNSALEEMCQAHVNSGGRYIYPDALSLSVQGEITTQPAADYEQIIWQKPLHGLAALIPIAWARAVGGFAKTEQIDGFYSRLALAGDCGQHLGRALVICRARETAKATKAQLRVQQTRRQKMENQTMASCCGGNGDAVMAAKMALDGMSINPVEPGQVRLEFIGPQVGAIPYKGKVTRRAYRGGNNDDDRYADVDEKDVDGLLAMGVWRRVPTAIRMPAPIMPVPQAAPIKVNAPEPVPEVVEVTEEDKALNAQITKQMRETRKRGKA